MQLRGAALPSLDFEGGAALQRSPEKAIQEKPARPVIQQA
jgi:hypothetical protein